MSEKVNDRVFISYSRKDGAKFAAELRHSLVESGFSVWQDLIALQGGKDWWSQIENAIKHPALEHLVLVTTPGSIASEVVRQEFYLARQQGVQISPVKGDAELELSSVPRWIGHVADLSISEQLTKLHRTLEGPSYQMRVPMMAPSVPHDFVDRKEHVDILKQELLDDKDDSISSTIVLRGPGGYGKSTIAKKIANDADISLAFLDGILWAELGEKPNDLVGTIGDLVERITGSRPNFSSLNAAASSLAEALGERRFLLIVDDAWRSQDVLPFLQGGDSTARLITTRLDTIVPMVDLRHSVEAMTKDQAAQMLATGLSKKDVATNRQVLAELAGRLGNWAQLLKLVNGFLQNRSNRAYEPLIKAIQGANDRLNERGLVAFDPSTEKDRTNAVAATISVSLDLLNTSSRLRFGELAIFPEDVEIPIEIVQPLWLETGALDKFETEDLLLELYSLSLLSELDLDKRIVRLHDTTRYFLLSELDASDGAELHKILHTRLHHLSEVGGLSSNAQLYFYTYLPFHLSGSCELELLDAVLSSPNWLQNKLDATSNPQSLIADYENFGTSELHVLIGYTLRLIAAIISKTTSQLLPQLLGRMMGIRSRQAESFIGAIRELISFPALLPMYPTMTCAGPEIFRLDGHNASVRSIVSLHDGNIASASDDNTIRIWHGLNGLELNQLHGHTNWVSELATFEDGTLVSGSSDGTVRFWKPDDGTQIFELDLKAGAISSMTRINDHLLAIGMWDSTIRIWDRYKQIETLKLRGHLNSVTSLTVTESGLLISGSSDTTIRVWDLEMGKEIKRFDNHEGTVSALTMLDDDRLASGSWDRSIRIWGIKTGAEITQLTGHTNWIRSLATFGDGRIISSSDDKTIRVWDTASRHEELKLKGHSRSVTTVEPLLEGRIVSGSDDKSIRMWRTTGFPELCQEPDNHNGSITTLAFNGMHFLASGSRDNTIRIWNTSTRKLVHEFSEHTNWVRALIWLNGGVIASASDDKTIRLWDIDTGKETTRMIGHLASVRALAKTPDGHIVSVSDDKSVRIWDPKYGREINRLEVDKGWVSSVSVLPSGGIVSGSDDGNLRLWSDPSSWESIIISRDLGQITTLESLANGRIITGSNDHTIRIWDLSSKNEVNQFSIGGRGILTICVSQSGLILVGSEDRSIRVWDIEAEREIAMLELDVEVRSIKEISNFSFVAGDEAGKLHYLKLKHAIP